MPYLTVGDLEMFYQARGTGPAVLFLHALGSCADDWALQFHTLADGYALLAPDLRGHGRTDRSLGSFTIAQMAADVAGLLAGLDIAKAHVVGLSLGGLVAQTLAVEHPQRVHSLVLVNTFARLRPRGGQNWWLMARRALALLVGGIDAQAKVVAEALFPRPDQQPLRQLVVQRLQANDPAVYRATIRAVLGFDSRRDLARIRVPTLVVAGAQDTTVSLMHKEELAAAIPGTRLVVVPDSGHATPVDQPDAFNALLDAFLREVPAV